MSKWGVVVGKPKMKTWKDYYVFGKPDMSQVGRWVGQCHTARYSLPNLYATRKEARAEAKECSRLNEWWNFHAKKYSGAT